MSFVIQSDLEFDNHIGGRLIAVMCITVEQVGHTSLLPRPSPLFGTTDGLWFVAGVVNIPFDTAGGYDNEYGACG